MVWGGWAGGEVGLDERGGGRPEDRHVRVGRRGQRLGCRAHRTGGRRMVGKG